MKEKGFTLMELLAVIVILAIIALIATPMILGVIDSAKKGAAESSVTGYVEAVEQYYVKAMMENKDVPTTIEELNKVVDVKGEKPSKGVLTFGDQQTITGAIFCMNNFYVEYSNGKAKVNKEKTCDDIKPDYKDNSGANQPKLEENMIPVVYENGTWVKANKLEKWYDYDAQMWANVVTVTETNRENYLSAEAGTEIKMEDINLMMVWVPRYEYKIEGEFGKGGTSASSPGEIEVSFVSGISKEASDGYFMHPGFTFGSSELTGLWIGKFEVSATELTNTEVGDDVTTKSIIVKPNVQSWRYNRIATAFEATRKMELANNPYGFAQTGTIYNTDGSIAGDSNQIDTHMARNTEWTAVAYLSQSKYGKYGNSNYSGANKEVYMNNHSGYQTGCSAGSPSAASSNTCDNTYDVADSNGSGVGASTTGTIYGVYDMNGGAWERVMANYNHMSGYTAISYTAAQAKTILGRTDNAAVGVWNSGFNGPVYGKALDGVTPLEWTTGVPFPNEKYYDYYGTTDRNTACNGGKCIGQNISEASGWYGDYADFVSASNPWFQRGGFRGNTAIAGVFGMGYTNGGASSARSFRVVLSIE